MLAPNLSPAKVPQQAQLNEPDNAFHADTLFDESFHRLDPDLPIGPNGNNSWHENNKCLVLDFERGAARRVAAGRSRVSCTSLVMTST
jgi:hypothetical protein